MGPLEDLRTETDALHSFLQELAGVLSVSAGQPPGVRDQLARAWMLVDGVVHANEVFMAYADPDVDMALEFLTITRNARVSLRQVARLVKGSHQESADDSPGT